MGKSEGKFGKLKPCPFCGGEAKLYYAHITKERVYFTSDKNWKPDEGVWHSCATIGCMNPKCILGINEENDNSISSVKLMWSTDNEENAIKAWNTREGHKPTQEELEDIFREEK